MRISDYLERGSYLPGYLVIRGVGTPEKMRLNILLGLIFAKNMVQKGNEQNKQNFTDKNYRMKTSVFYMCQPTLNGIGGTRKDMGEYYPQKMKK